MIVEVGGMPINLYASMTLQGVQCWGIPRWSQIQDFFSLCTHHTQNCRIRPISLFADYFDFFFFSQVLGNKVKLPNTLLSKESPPRKNKINLCKQNISISVEKHWSYLQDVQSI